VNASQIAMVHAYVQATIFVGAAIYLSVKQRRLHPLLLLCISAISFCWIEAPYDWAMYAQFAPEAPRMPDWWPVNKTYGGLPAVVPPGYVAYFVLPAIVGTFLSRKLIARYGFRQPITLLNVGLLVGFVWALAFNGFLGPRTGLFYYGRVIEHLALFEGSKYQYPVYDAVAMGIQMMVFTYLLGRRDSEGRSLPEMWARSWNLTRARTAAFSIGGAVLVGHLVYGSVFLPHLITKLRGDVTVSVPGQLFPGVPNQPF